MHAFYLSRYSKIFSACFFEAYDPIISYIVFKKIIVNRLPLKQLYENQKLIYIYQVFTPFRVSYSHF